MKNKYALYFIIFSTAWSTLTLELLQTRVLSLLYYNNIVYLTVTVALMGFGISGVFVSIFSRKLKNPEKLASLTLGLFSISALYCLRRASYLPVVAPDSSTLIELVRPYLILILPFIFSGCTLGLIFMTHGRDIYRLYFIDLIASALGALCFTFLLRPLGADALIWLVSIVALSGFIVYAAITPCAKRYIFIIVPLFLLGLIFWGNSLVNDEPAHYKFAGWLRDHKSKIECSIWTTIAKIDIWSEGTNYYKILTQDGDAPTAFPSALHREKHLCNQTSPKSLLIPQSLPYLIRPKPDNALIIGPGGGQEIVIANTFGAKHIDGAEINPATCALVRGRYRDYIQWPMWDNVTLFNAEGRHFVGAADKKYDVISMTGVDTLTALNSGAYVLSENYLYTVEAIEQYLNALTPHGTMFMCRWMFDTPREALRLANIFLYGAERCGIKKPSQCIMVIGWYFKPTIWAATLIKRDPFTTDEVETILRRINGQRDMPVIYLPDIYPDNKQQDVEAKAFLYKHDALKFARAAYYGLIRAETLEKRRTFENEYLYNITPVYDDRPFFFEYHKITEIFSADKMSDYFSRGTIVHYVLFYLLAFTSFVSFVAMILPLYIFEKEGLKVDRIWTLLGFFCCLGMGFMFLELGFIQKLSIYLGHPMYTLAVVLAGILMFTGIGSYYAGTRAIDRVALLKQGMIGTALLSVIWLLIINWVIPRTLGAPLLIRILVSLCSIFPIGLVMGIPFATGLRYLEERYPRFIPWAWGINGLTSVMGSVLAIIIAMRIGFTVVVLLGCVTYVFGLFAILYHLKSNLMSSKG
jgi:hypothetical protein